MDSIVGFASLLAACTEQLVDAGAADRGSKTALKVFDFRSELVELANSEMEIARNEHPSGRDIAAYGLGLNGRTHLKKLYAGCALKPQVVGKSVVLHIGVSPTRQPEMQALAKRAGRWCFDTAKGWVRCLNP